MKTSVALLTLCLFYLSEAEVLDGQAGEGNGTKIPNIELACVCAGNITGNQSENCQLFVTARELEAKLKNNETQRGVVRAEIILTSRNVYSDTGAYDPATGIYTAPVKGDYYFSFSGSYVTSGSTRRHRKRNRVRMVAVFNDPTENQRKTATDGMTLQLEKGDQVQMKLPPIRMRRGLRTRMRIIIIIIIKF